MAAKSYKEWKPTADQALVLADAADVFGQMVWDAATEAAEEKVTLSARISDEIELLNDAVLAIRGLYTDAVKTHGTKRLNERIARLRANCEGL